MVIDPNPGRGGPGRAGRNDRTQAGEPASTTASSFAEPETDALPPGEAGEEATRALGSGDAAFGTGTTDRLAGVKTDDDVRFTEAETDSRTVPVSAMSSSEPAPTLPPLELEGDSEPVGPDVTAPEPAFRHPDDLAVHIEPRYEWGSAPASADPVMSVLLTLTPDGPPLVADGTGPVAHVILAIDLSASMNHPDKYPVLTQALSGMIADLQQSGGRDVLVSIIAFAQGSKTLYRAVPASSITARDVLRAIDACPLRFGRYTDIVGALSRAGRLAYDTHATDKALPVRIYVLTDGKPQDVEGARDRMHVIGKLPVDVDALAFGSDADVDILKSLVGGGRGGSVKHVRTETLADAYGRIADSAQRVVAKRAILRIEMSRGVVGGAAYRFRPARHAFGPNAFRQGQVFETDLGTLETGRPYQILFQVRLPQTTAEDTEIGQVLLRVPGWGGPREYRCTLAVPRHRHANPVGADPIVVEARSVLEALDVPDAQAQLKALRARRKIYVSERRDPFLLEVVDKAIAEIEARGNLDALTNNERAALTAHTATAGSGKPRPNRREYTFG